MKTDQFKTFFWGIILGLALVLLMGSNDQEGADEDIANGRYHFYES